MNKNELAVDAPLERGVGPLYARRDTLAQGEHFVRHMHAMTAEDLRSKFAIAAELAHRDMEIELLRAAVAAERERCAKLCEDWASVRTPEHGGLALLNIAERMGSPEMCGRPK